MISAPTSVKAGELLAEGYAFCTFDGTEFIMYETLGTDLSVLGALTVVFCPHTTTDEDGNCRICKTQIYVAEVIKADGTATEYEVFADAWIAAIDNEGSTLKLLCDITLNKAGNGIPAQSGKFTVDLNGKTVSGDITQQLLTVSDTADITIRNGKLLNTFSKDGQDMNLSSANVLKIDGGTVTLEQVELIAGQEFEGARSYGAYIFSGSLTVVGSTFTGTLAVADIYGAHPTVKITSATLHNGFLYSNWGTTDFDYAGLKAVFADGSMLFDKDGQYIDAGDEAYWNMEGEGESAYVSFSYGEKCVVKPYTHTYADGVCSGCGYTCPQNSEKRQALQPAVFSVGLFFGHGRNEIFDGVTQLWMADHKVNCRRFAFGYHHPLPLVNEDLKIAECVGSSLLNRVVGIFLCKRLGFAEVRRIFFLRVGNVGFKECAGKLKGRGIFGKFFG